MAIIIDGKPLEEWYLSDEGLIDYSKSAFKKNVSNHPDYVICDLGEFEHDPEVRETHYCNGVDLARVMGAVEFEEPYKGMSYRAAYEGDDYVRIFYNHHPDATPADFVLYFFHLVDGYVYISETTHHVYIKGLRPSDEIWMKAVREFNNKFSEE